MDAVLQLLFRMAFWLRKRPARDHVLVMAIVVVVAAFCVGFEAMFGWPPWLTLERAPRTLLMRP